jgi:hypothetical protein
MGMLGKRDWLTQLAGENVGQNLQNTLVAETQVRRVNCSRALAVDPDGAI